VNSGFGLWLLSTLFLTGLGNAYRIYEANHLQDKIRLEKDDEARRRRQNEVRRLDREISFRFDALLRDLGRADRDWIIAIRERADGDAVKNWNTNAVVQKVFNASSQYTSQLVMRATRPLHEGDERASLFQQYSNESLDSLLDAEVMQLDGSDAAAVSAVRRRLESLSGASYQNAISPAAQVGRVLFSHCILARWKTAEFPNTTCSARLPFCRSANLNDEKSLAEPSRERRAH
jgi:hypothetical protein